MPGGTPVAVVGIGCRFPGARGADELWDLMAAGRESLTEVPAERFDLDAVYDPRPGTPNRLVSRRGGFLEHIDEFDAGYFGLAPREAAEMDPQQRLLLETAGEAIEDAGLTPAELTGSRTGVFVGAMAGAYWDMMRDAGVLDVYAMSGGTRSILSGRLSFAFDLRGPSTTVDTACSSSLVALHLAYQSLCSGESALALAAGVNLVLLSEESIPFSQAKMLSPDGRCKFASSAADGFVRSEGVGVVLLKPLDRAVADGDRIHAVLYGTAMSSDGQSNDYMMTPSQSGQEDTLRAAYRSADVDPALVDYVEAHGTGTPAGDPVELGSLATVLGPGREADRPCLVGSVKTNIGHTEAAAGMAGLIKTILCLRHRQIPASLHADQLTERVAWADVPLQITSEATEWPDTGRPGLAGVSSFGISGTNAHVVLGEYQPAADDVADEADDTPGDTAQLLTLSAPSPDGLRALVERYVAYLGPDGTGRDLALRDICHSAAARRRHHDNRLTAVGHSHQEITDQLSAFLAGEASARMGTAQGVPDPADRPERPKVVFVYPGQGSQWVGMGRELMATSPVFREIIADCDRIIAEEAGWSLIDRLNSDDEFSGIDLIQPTLWAMQTALTGLWRSWGISPDVVVGHSMGEVAAACASGALSRRDAGAVICRRSSLLRGVAGRGAMLNVELSVEDAERELAGHENKVSVAVSNSPTSTVLSGDPAVLEGIAATLDGRGVFTRMVKVDVASHSPQMDPLREDLLTALKDLDPTDGDIPLFSTVDQEARQGAELDGTYWVRNLREPVRFGAVVDELARAQDTVFVEVSPHPILLAAIKECLSIARVDGAAVFSLRRGEPELATMLDAVGTLHRTGFPVPWRELFGEPRPQHVTLPGYPWQRQRFWFEAA
ncbi:MAG: type I polyketide synthase, partial [Actinocatenispora sp.]